MYSSNMQVLLDLLLVLVLSFRWVMLVLSRVDLYLVINLQACPGLLELTWKLTGPNRSSVNE
jgi:hypothetical protein